MSRIAVIVSLAIAFAAAAVVVLATSTATADPVLPEGNTNLVFNDPVDDALVDDIRAFLAVTYNNEDGAPRVLPCDERNPCES